MIVLSGTITFVQHAAVFLCLSVFDFAEMKRATLNRDGIIINCVFRQRFIRSDTHMKHVMRFGIKILFRIKFLTYFRSKFLQKQFNILQSSLTNVFLGRSGSSMQHIVRVRSDL